MLSDLREAITHLIQARRIIRRHLPNRLYPYLHEDLDYDITALREIIIDGGLANRPQPKKAHGHEA